MSPRTMWSSRRVSTGMYPTTEQTQAAAERPPLLYSGGYVIALCNEKVEKYDDSERADKRADRTALPWWDTSKSTMNQ